MKRNLLIITAVFATCAATLNAQIPTNGLQLYYQFDGNVADSSGNGNDASTSGTNDFSHTGLAGVQDSCFEGAGNYELYYDYSSNSSAINVQDFSCVIWVKFNSLTNLYTNLMENGSSSTNVVYFRLFTTGSTSIQAGMYQVGVGGNTIQSGAILTDLTDGSWNMFAYTSKIVGLERIQELYLNGVLVDSETTTSNITFNYDPSYSRLNIGHRDDAINFEIDGQINNFLYYDRALTAEEIAGIQNPSTSGNTENLVSTNLLSIYPNPANEIAVIQNIEIGSTIQITDLSGKLVYADLATEELITISTSNFENGVYLVQTIFDGKIQQEKLVVQH